MIKIMLVEDNPAMQETLAGLIRQHFASAEVHVAATVAEAEVLASVVEPQLIFMDVGLPDGNGFTLAKRLRKVHGNIPVAFLSAADSPEYHQAARDVGASHYFNKAEVSDQEILGLVQGIVDRETLQKGD